MATGMTRAKMKLRADDPALVAAYRNFAKSPHGAIVLADLRESFLDRPLAPVVVDALTAGIAIGAHDVVRHIVDMGEITIQEDTEDNG